jgi:hypothetical protein
MKIINLADYRLDRRVDDLFAKSAARYEQQCENPVTGGHYVGGLDPIEPQKRMARLALIARECFAVNGPPDAPPLPLSYDEREDLKIGGLATIVALYARSWEGRDYDQDHPTFFDYACGVMASDHMGYPGIKEDAQLRKRFPPCQLTGLGPGLCWEPPKLHAQTMASYRRSLARAAS